MDLVQIERAIQAVLAEEMGSIGTGMVVARSTGATGTVPAFSFALPTTNGIEEDRAVFASKNPDTEDGSWPVTSAGVAVAVQSVHGGAHVKFPAGTEFRWFPALPGIQPTATASAEFSGAESDTSLGALRQLRTHAQFNADKWKAFYQAQLGQFPGAILCWESFSPTDGPVLNANNPRTSRMSRGGILHKILWQLFCVTSRVDSEPERRMEMMVFIQRLSTCLQGKEGTREAGLRVSVAPGLQVLSANVHNVTPTSYVYVLRFQTTAVLEQRVSGTGANPWMRTHLEAFRPPENDTQAELKVPNIDFSMVPPEPEPEEEDP